MSADRTRLRRGEFELRQRQLPADRRARNMAGRAWQAARDDIARTPLGAPQKPYDVRSVYDSRPVHGYDFMIPVTVDPEGAAATFSATFNVREGYVAVLREISHFFPVDPQPAVVTRADCLLTVQLNGGTVLDNENVPVGVSSEALWKGFVIADEFDTLGALIELQGALTADSCIVIFYGNYLLKSGTVAPFEIANPSQSGRMIRQPAPRMPRPPKPESTPEPPSPQSPTAATPRLMPTPAAQPVRRGPLLHPGRRS